jgi:thiol-disulfide isomerase/thioredoxin
LSPQASQALWSSSFDTPQGASLALSSLRGKPLLINFWATWCTPCVQEIPLLMDFYRQNAINGWQLLGLAIDQPTPVRRFITDMGMTYPIGMAGLNGTELMKELGNDRGGLPFTLALAADGRVLMKKLGQLHAADLADLAKVS